MNATLTALKTANSRNATQYANRNSVLAPRPAQPTQRPVPTGWRAMLPLIESVPEGHYAMKRKDGTTGFVQVTKTKDGRTFINTIYGAPGTFRSVKMGVRMQWFTAQHLLEDLHGALKRFADEHGVCAKCKSPLTVPLSVARGLGPTCYLYY